MRPLFGLLTLLPLFCGCSSQYSIDGNSSLSCLDGKRLYLRVPQVDTPRTRYQTIDSCEVVHGRFRFGGSSEAIVMAEVYVGNDVLMPVVLEGGQLFLQLDNYGQSVKGGPLNERLSDFLNRRSNFYNELWELEREMRQAMFLGNESEASMARTKAKRDELLTKISTLEENFVCDNADNVLGPGYFMSLAQENGFPVLTDQLRRIADRAPKGLLASPSVKRFLTVTGYLPRQMAEKEPVATRPNK